MRYTDLHEQWPVSALYPCDNFCRPLLTLSEIELSICAPGILPRRGEHLRMDHRRVHEVRAARVSDVRPRWTSFGFGRPGRNNGGRAGHV